MARNPVNRAITNAAAALKKGGSGYHFILPDNYLELIDRSRVAANIAAGMSKQRAAFTELSSVATLVLDRGGTMQGQHGLEFLAEVNRWNRQVSTLLINERKKSKDKKADVSVRKIEPKKILNTAKVEATITGITPQALVELRRRRGIENLEQSLQMAHVPADIINEIKSRLTAMSASDINKVLKTSPVTIEIYGSDEQGVKVHLQQLMQTLGIPLTEKDANGNDRATYLGTLLIGYTMPVRY